MKGYETSSRKAEMLLTLLRRVPGCLRVGSAAHSPLSCSTPRANLVPPV